MTQQIQQIQVLVTLLPNGQVQVSGPIEDKILCLGLLEVAKATIMSHQAPQQPQSPQIVPFANIPGRDNGGRRV